MVHGTFDGYGGRHVPDAAVACVGGGSNAIGLFHAFRDDVGLGA